MRTGKYFSIAAIIMALHISLELGAQQAGWRGPGRTGVYNETSLLKVWPAEGPSLLWESSGFGTSYASVTVTSDAIYLTGRKGEKDFLTALTQEGKKKWEVEIGLASKSNYPESRCTPTVVNGNIYVVSGQGDLSLITAEGKKVWSVNYFQKYSAKVPMFGISESPLVVDNKVIGTPGGSKAALVAFEASTGKVLWETAPLNEGAQYVNPLLIEEKGQKYIVTHSLTQVFCVNAADGKIVWKFDYEAINSERDDRIHINTPIYRDGFLFAANGYGQTSAKLKVTFDGKAPQLVWKNPDFNPHIGGMVLLGNYLYGSTHDNNSKGRWICTDWTTGKTMWITDWNNKGSVISADGMLYIYEERQGNVGLVKPNSEKFELVSSFRITKGSGPHWAHPVINNGRLFIRHGDYLAAYSIKAK